MKYKDSDTQEKYKGDVSVEKFVEPDCKCGINPNVVLRYIIAIMLIVIIVISLYLLRK